jgi:hypothetical protein
MRKIACVNILTFMVYDIYLKNILPAEIIQHKSQMLEKGSTTKECNLNIFYQEKSVFIFFAQI